MGLVSFLQKVNRFTVLDSEVPARIKFNVLRAMKTKYHIDSFQRTYFVIQSFQELFDALRNLDWEEVEKTCTLLPEIEQGVILNDQEKIILKELL